jgi:hypothetical protein
LFQGPKGKKFGWARHGPECYGLTARPGEAIQGKIPESPSPDMKGPCDSQRLRNGA